MSFWAKNARTTTIRMGNAALLKNRLTVRSQSSGGIPPAFAALIDLSVRFLHRIGQHCDVGQVPVALGMIEAVSDGEAVRYLEADVADREVHLPPLRLRAEGAHLERPRVACAQRAQQVLQGQARVHDV